MSGSPGPGPRLMVALDGPASSGKSSVGAAAARALGYRFCDTGLLYRALTGLALRRGVDLSDPAGLVPLVDEVQLADGGGGSLSRVLVDGVDVTDAVHGPDVDRSVSELSRVPEVRAALLARQRSLAEPGRIVMAGRDIGTVVLPGADLRRRDALDRDRPVAPLRAADDALVIATDGNTFEQTVAAVEAAIRTAETGAAGAETGA